MRRPANARHHGMALTEIEQCARAVQFWSGASATYVAQFLYGFCLHNHHRSHSNNNMMKCTRSLAHLLIKLFIIKFSH